MSVENKLHTLSMMDSDTIADMFRRRGILGLQGSTTACPVAVYLREPGLFISVAHRFAKCWEASEFGTPDRMTDMLRLPITVEVFVSKFDEGHYPDLVAE